MAVPVLAVVGTSPPAGADPARPTDHQSRIVTVEPALPPGVELEVVGGDSFLELDVSPGHTAEVPDYASGDGPTRTYLRFGDDGTVERNEHSAAASANEDRYGGSGEAHIDDEPRWVEVGDDGAYAWHDHRIHWMLPDRDPAVDDDGRVDLGGPDGTWTVDLVVDGRPTTVTGELVILDPPSPLPWVGLMLVTAAVVVGVVLRLCSRARAYRLVAAALTVGAAAAVAVGVGEWRTVPAGAGGSALPALVPAVGLLAGAVALVAPPSAGRLRLIALAAAAAALGGWALVRRAVLTRAVLPTNLPPGLDRAGTALALGLAVGVAVVLVWRPPVSTARSSA